MTLKVERALVSPMSNEILFHKGTMRLKNESRNKEVRTRLGRKLELKAFLVRPVIILVYSLTLIL